MMKIAMKNNHKKLLTLLIIPALLVSFIILHPQSVSAAQFARPDGDNDPGLWTTAPLWSKVNEGSPGDGVEISSDDVGNNTDTSIVEFSLSAITDPGMDTGHLIRVRWRNGGEGGADRTIEGRVELREGATQIALFESETDGQSIGDSTAFIEDTFVLTEAMASSIDNYANLNLRIWGRGTSGGPSRSLRVDFVELEAPAGSVLTQQNFQIFENTASTTPGSAIVDENAVATEIKQEEVIRIRMNIEVTEADLQATSTSFRLQYAEKTTPNCTELQGNDFSDVGATSSDEIWRGFSTTTTPNDGDELSNLLLTGSNVAGTYEEHNPSAPNPNAIPAGSFGEWDWVVQNNGASSNTSYCFRMVKSDNTEFSYNRMAEVKVIRGLTQLKYRWRDDDGGE